ncbi:MAG: AAA family ATPase [Balneolaceae bacterium]|nr:AAA family ATPase [Balneolaceae bacterium]
MLPINAFSIENFKSFGPKQRFPLKRVNFLFGPNSQGKTASLIALGLLMNGYLKRKTDLNKITHLDNSPEIEIGFQNVNKSINQDFYLFESESVETSLDYNIKLNKFSPEKTRYFKKMFFISEDESRVLKKFQLFEVISEKETLVIELTDGSVTINLDSEYLNEQSDLTIDDTFPKSWSSNVKIDNIDVDLKNVRVSKKLQPGKGYSIAEILNNPSKEVSIVNDILDLLFTKFIEPGTRSPIDIPLDWVGPNRSVSNNSCSVNGKKDFIEDSFLNSNSVNEMNIWLQNSDLIDLGYDLIVKELDKSKSETSFTLKEFGVKRYGEDELLKMSEVGSGISHVFQMILPLFNQVEFLIIQQPEIHLHPSLQVQLCKALIKLSKEKNVQLIFETHSEHFIKAAQLEIAMGLPEDDPTLTNEDLSVLYISKDDDGFSKVKQMEVDKTGAFTEPWPDDFFELSADLSLERLRNSIKSRN